MTRKLGAEFIGTFWLVLGGCGSAVLAATFPETGIGIYPGLGGTQRTARKVGRGLAKWMNSERDSKGTSGSPWARRRWRPIRSTCP